MSKDAISSTSSTVAALCGAHAHPRLEGEKVVWTITAETKDLERIKRRIRIAGQVSGAMKGNDDHA